MEETKILLYLTLHIDYRHQFKTIDINKNRKYLYSPWVSLDGKNTENNNYSYPILALTNQWLKKKLI